MRLSRSICIYGLSAAFAVLTASSASAEDQNQSRSPGRSRPVSGRPQSGGENSFRRGTAVGQKHEREMQLRAARRNPESMPPIESLTSKQRQAIETRDFLMLSRHLYQPSTEEVQVLHKIITNAQEESHSLWEKFGPVVDARAAIYAKLTQDTPASEFPEEARKALLADSEFAKLDEQVRELEKLNHQRYIERFKEFEQNLSGEAIESSRQHWDERIRTLPSYIQTAGLLEAFAEIAGTKVPEDLSLLHQSPLRSATPERPSPEARRARELNARTRAAAAKERKKPVEQRPAAAQAAPRPQPAPPRPEAAPAEIKKTSKPEPAKTTPPAPVPPGRPLSEWEKYVYDFIETHELNDSQRNSALSILKDLTARGQQVERSNVQRVAAAQALKDEREKKAKLAELNAPIDRLFHELRQRLEALLTSSQKARAKAAEPAKSKR